MQDVSRMQENSSGDVQASENNRDLAIILGSVLGGCAALLIIGILIWVMRRKKTQGSSMISRAVTPLDDAEFESWRRPSKQLQWREKYNVLPEPPVPALTRMPSSSRRNRHSRQISRLSQLTEKELEDETPMYSYRPKPSRTPEPGIAVHEHVRNKSSLSLQDRPPTPYSPTSSKESPKFPTQPTHTRPKSVSQRTNHVHYPSMSEASDFDFGFQQNNNIYDKI
ncbi:c2h2 transcription [Diplodia corticola]|uniref:C2h2 transcription n=1 Tax=Diplodia corticola TaxID=236234 RepID=A0A1J9S1B6_9PEZI|nr:c2h2 transcription [Diplodia corticola]OJD38739.1 c2h2 transcription [Diplodia corticola]